MIQIHSGDILSWRDREFELVDAPLEPYFSLIGSRPDFAHADPDSRGYQARWLIDDGWLYLTDLDAIWADGTTVSLAHLFPLAGSKVFAAWMSGTLRAYRADRSPMSGSSVMRAPDMVIRVDCGRIKASSVVHRPVLAASRGRSLEQVAA